MIPRDELRQSLFNAIKKIEILCDGFGYKPAEDLRRLVTNVVQKADESKAIIKPPIERVFDNPHIIWAQHEDQFKSKYVGIVQTCIIPAIKKYFAAHPNVDLKVFEPIINIRIIMPSTAALKIGKTVIIQGQLSPKKTESLMRKIFDTHTRGVFRDDNWKPFHAIMNDLSKAGLDPVIQKSAYKQDKEGNQTGKDWYITIPFGDKGGWHVHISASFGPSQVGKTDAYDLTATFNWDGRLVA
jgi:hypothetical protein